MRPVVLLDDVETAVTLSPSGALKVPCVTGQVTESAAELPVSRLREAGFVASVQVGCGAITTFRVAVRMYTPLITCSKIVYFPFTAADEAENVRDWLVAEVAPKLTLTP